MIDLTTERPLSISQAADLMPPGRNGARVSVGCIHRWILRGAKSPTGEMVQLEACRLGSRWITSTEAIQRFMDRLTPQLGATTPPSRSPGTRRRAVDAAARRLERIGI